MSLVLLDTNILIDYLRGVPKAVKYLEDAAMEKAVSALTVAELHAGARIDQERIRRKP